MCLIDGVPLSKQLTIAEQFLPAFHETIGSSNNCYLQRLNKIMSMEHARRRYIRSDRAVGCAKVSSAISCCARCLAQKHAKIDNYTYKIIIPARTLPPGRDSPSSQQFS